jgi:hypothetical protein
LARRTGLLGAALRDAVRARVASAIGPDLQPALQDGAGRWPPCVRSGTNITAAHDPEPYLCARVTGAAIAAAMG